MADETNVLSDSHAVVRHLARALEHLSTSAATQDVADELAALSSIYDLTDGEPALSLHTPPPTFRAPSPARPWTPSSGRPLRLVLSTTVSDAHDYPLHILISIPAGYPASEPPLLQLHDRYIGPELVSDELFGVVLRTYMHEEGLGSGVLWSAGDVCLYEGLEWVRERCAEWVSEKAEERRKREVVRLGVSVYRIGEDESKLQETDWDEEVPPRDAAYYADEAFARKLAREEAANTRATPAPGTVCPQIFSSAPIMDRGSTFVGHAARISTPDEVDLVLSALLADKRIGRAAHNMHAYRCTTVDGILHHDCDDDGETAAGGRMAHLLGLLDVENVVVVVSRWFGGIHIGPDRFKHINAAVRDSLLMGGFLEEKVKKGGKKKW